jgi:RNA polymerase sigma factor (sigma-70 family)
MSATIRRAAAGDTICVATIVERFTPALLMQAEHRLGSALRRYADPHDVVNDAWLGALRRLAEFNPAEGRAVPTMLAYLGVAVLRRVHELYRKHLVGKPALVTPDGEPDNTVDLAAQLPAETTGVVTRALRAERFEALHRAIEALDPTDRAVVVLRAIEQQPNDVVASVTGLAPNAVSQRLRRAMAKLRERLPASIFDELDDA